MRFAFEEASRGFEPLMRILQTLALPLGHDAIYLIMLITNKCIRYFWAGDGIRTHDLLLGKETYYHCTTPAFLGHNFSRECRDPGSNWGHRDFQSRALPTELSRLMYFFVKRPWFYTYLYRLSRKACNSIVICYECNLLLDFLYPFRYNVRSLSEWDS